MRLKFAGGFLSGIVLWSSLAAADGSPRGPSAAPAPSTSATSPAAAAPSAPVAPAPPELPKGAIGFSKLVFRIKNEAQIAVSKEELGVFVLEALREQGFNAVGAENLVFDQDRSRDAEFVLGGTLTELECLELNGRLNCRIAIEWQLLDVAADSVRYTAMTRGASYGADPRNADGLGRALVLSALNSLTRRKTFVSQLDTHEARHAPAGPNYAKAAFKRCDIGERAMPGAAEQVLPATALLESGIGFGSGFFLTSDGLLLTAAHVVGTAQTLKVRLKDGSTYAARVVRVNRILDAALLKVDGIEATAPSCLDVALEAQPLGSELYAIGAPASQTLAFSLTRGIVSGIRESDGQPLLQTDAAVNPGNSGGPLVDTKGRAAAIVSFKLTGSAIQGLAFGVPVANALSGLGLEPGAQTDAALLAGQAGSLAALESATKPFVDAKDALPTLDPEGDWHRADEEARRAAKAEKDARDDELAKLRSARTPAYAKAMRYGGLGLSVLGGVTVFAVHQSHDEDRMTRAKYNQLNALNIAGWSAIGLGFGAFLVSYTLIPKVTEADLERSKAPSSQPAPAKLSLGVTGRDVQVKVQF